MPVKHSQEIRDEAIRLFSEGMIDTDISKILGVSTTFLRNLRKEHNIRSSDGDKRRMISVEKMNEIIDLIREGAPLNEICSITGVSKNKIKSIHSDEIKDGNPLPDIVKGVAIRTKYTDEELIELAYLNPGFGFKRFTKHLSIHEKTCFELFMDLKEFTNGMEDLYALLQDESQGTMVTREEYQEITGKKYPPKGSGLSTSRAPGTNKGNNHKSIFLPPQIFNWGHYVKKEW